MDWTEVYQGLQQGVVDGAEAPLPSIQSSKLNEVAKQVGLTYHMLQANITIANDKWYRSLPDDLRKVFDEEMRSGGDYMMQLTKQQEDAAQGDLKAKGMTFTEPNLDGFREAARQVPRAFEADWGPDFWDKLQEAKGS
jgi:TRAP-type C4-dicarboxylate transport system substrate-binding protein